MSRLPAQPRLPQNVRQRRLADGSTRIWWEPSARARELGFASVQLDPARLTWSSREAEKLNRELDQALKTGRRPAPVTNGGRTIEALIDSYTRSSHFRRRPEKTQRSYQAQFRMILAKWGPSNVADFSKPVMHTWYEALLEDKGDYTAIARLRHMSILFSHAELIGWRAEGSNPCSKLKMAVPKGRRRTYSWDEFDALLVAARGLGLQSLVTAITLGMLQGQRQTDLRNATCGAFRQQQVQMPGRNAPRLRWTWQLTRSKRGNEGAMILHEEAELAVHAAIEAAEARLRQQHPGRIMTPDLLDVAPLLVDEGYGHEPYIGPRGEYRFQNRWQAVKAAAIETLKKAGRADAAEALAGVQFRDLRRTFGGLSRAGGATKDDTADVLGNSAAVDRFLGDVYMAPQFETASRAVLAVRRPKGKKQVT